MRAKARLRAARTATVDVAWTAKRVARVLPAAVVAAAALALAASRRASGRSRSTPRSSSKEERELVRSHDLGANSYIQKPVDVGQFQEVVRQPGLYGLVVNEPPPETRVVAE
jgi:hypothetical protein